MTRRRVFLLSGLLLIALLAAFGLWWTLLCTEITEENYARIEVGMSKAEVERVLGGPARDESSGSLVPRTDQRDFREATHLFRLITSLETKDAEANGGYVWKSDHAIILVILDPEGLVNDRFSVGVQRDGSGIWQRIRGWLAM